MSKSLNYLIPAAGGAALVMGVAYGMASREYRAEELEVLQSRVEQVEQHAETAQAQAKTAAERAAELDAQVAEVQAAAVARQSMVQDLTAPAPVSETRYGLGRVAVAEEIEAWDEDVLPDGRGLPVGSGDVLTGEEVFVEQCASCHGDFAEGVDNWPVLAGGFDTLADKDPVKTVGSYWPHLSTAFDYIYRSMPFGAAGTLTPDETYGIVAYILYSNDLVDDDFVLSNENFTDVQMYNKDGFVVDDRPELEYAKWRTEPCMTNCKDSVGITRRATFVDVTPSDGGASVMNHSTTTETPVFSAAAAPEATEVAETAAVDPALFDAGKKVFRKCASCHAIGEGARNKSGPELNNILDRPIGSIDGFKYSNVLKDAGSAGQVWDVETLSAFLANPRQSMRGTKMAFSGLKKESDIAAMLAYLDGASE